MKVIKKKQHVTIDAKSVLFDVRHKSGAEKIKAIAKNTLSGHLDIVYITNRQRNNQAQFYSLLIQKSSVPFVL